MKKWLKRLKQQIVSVWGWVRNQALNNPLGTLIVFAFIVWAGYTLWITHSANRLGFDERELWDWMKLLLVPAALAAAGFWFSKVQKDTELEIAEKERETDREIALEKQRQQTLENYLDRMKELILEKGLGREAEPEVKRLARTLTLNVLRELESERNRQAVQFLHESELLGKRQIVDLNNVDLSRTNLSGTYLHMASLNAANLSGADLSMASLNGACLRWSNLREANLFRTEMLGADLNGAELNEASLRQASLVGANMKDVNLSGADLFEAILAGADLSKANLSGANLSEAYLIKADLREANLNGTKVTFEQLSRAVVSDETIMPDGRSYKEWKQEGKKIKTVVSVPKTESEEE
jgi:uncharacterized protein YjbI with pentapeptide repeats